MIETHPLPPFLPTNAKLLMLGSFPPPRQNWKMDFYYPNYNNDMWRIFGLVFKQDSDYFLDIAHKRFKEAHLRAFLAQKGIAIYDVAYQVKRQTGNASDLHLEILQHIDLSFILTKIPHCQSVVTTGEKATQTLLSLLLECRNKPSIGTSVSCEYALTHLAAEQTRSLQIFRMPSSSRAYPLALLKKAQYYANMFQQLNMI